MFASSANLATLEKRAQLFREVRAFFYARQVMEVDVPVLAAASVTDVNLEALHCQVNGVTAYLQTSPEFYMKRLLAMGSGDIFYLGKAFRQDESGRRHRPEFTMLEWYRTGFDSRQLGEEVIALVQQFKPAIQVHRCTYAELFNRHYLLNPHRASLQQLIQLARERFAVTWDDDNSNTWLDLLFTHGIEPAMATGLTLVEDYPASQAALARLATNADGDRVAKRFEIYWDGLELANGYWELTSANEQRQRFAQDLALRQHQGKPLPPVDIHLLAALDHGLPDCAGVALGVDRLLMKILEADDIASVIPFADG